MTKITKKIITFMLMALMLLANAFNCICGR